MIVGLGIDLVELSRIRRSLERFGGHFLRRLLHPSELEAACERLRPGRGSAPEDQRVFSPSRSGQLSLPIPAERLTPFAAARFAAKEAGAKALGTGFAGGIGLHDIRILSLTSGKPIISFHGQALATAVALGVTTAHLSLTHARESAGAVVVLEADGHSAP
jgi:holo-[acyl-carrier protein] synthase